MKNREPKRKPMPWKDFKIAIFIAIPLSVLILGLIFFFLDNGFSPRCSLLLSLLIGSIGMIVVYGLYLKLKSSFFSTDSFNKIIKPVF